MRNNGHAYSHNVPIIGQISLRTLVLMLILPALAIYSWFLGNPFFFDDQSIKWTALADEFPATLQPRLVAAILNWANGTLLGGSPAYFRLVNLALHLANAILIFFLGRRLLAIAFRGATEEKRTTEIAFSGALLFTLHPVTVYAVGYLVQRTILLATFFSLLTAWAHLRAQVENRSALLAVAATGYALAVYSKEHSVMLPLALAMLSIWLHIRGHRWQWRWTPAFVAYLAIAASITYLVKNNVPPGGLYEPTAQYTAYIPNLPYLRSVASQLILFFKYLGLWILPNPSWLSVDLQHNLPAYVLVWPAIAGGAAFTGFLIVLCQTFARPGAAGILSLLGVWAVALFISELWATRLTESFVLYRSYLWMCWTPLAVVVATGVLLTPHAVVRRTAVPLLLTTALCFGAILVERLSSMSSDLRLWEDAVAKNEGTTWPGAARALHNLGMRHYEAGRRTLGVSYYERSLHLNPDFYHTLCRLGDHFLKNKDTLAQAKSYYARAATARPSATCGPLGLVMVSELQGEYSQALAGIREIIQRWPQDNERLIDLAVLQIQTGDTEQAKKTLRIAKELIPNNNALVYYNTALLQEREQMLAEAVATVEEGLRKLHDNTRLLAYGAYLRQRTDQHSTMKRWQPQRPSVEF